ncbi:MAG: methylmalonyl Co-A mutase-associated GTPase MeaB [Propionibacteriaceae bacterium]|jgi:LAO/AO transport system kinase|nr:methylmalonyl Co-A mutase-associated GTPase MeaB [Propionibacteriaceae bacterium]
MALEPVRKAGIVNPVQDLAEGVFQGNRRQIARAITLVESMRMEDRVKARELLGILRERPTSAVRIGVTGVPGAGKSTFIDAIGVKLIELGKKVAVLAVDPSSSKTGGSILGDRTRMGALAVSDDAFIRPSPSGNHLGGVARATRESMLVVEAAGYDVVLVETVGVGQSEVAVAGMVDTFLLVTLARAGDQLQGIKKGILEMADIITVNKADGDNEAAARVAARELTTAMKLITADPKARRPPVLTSSSYTGMGLMDLWAAILDHREYLQSTGGLNARRARQQRDWMWSLVDDELLESVRQTQAVKVLRHELEQQVMDGTTSAMEAAQEVLTTFAANLPPTWMDED